TPVPAWPPLPRYGLLSFFFQAEDGIRDFHVTGVQTCALPIYDFHVFAKSREDIQRAVGITKTKLKELGLEIAEGKTRVVNFKKDDFDFLGFTFQHWTVNKKGKPVFHVVPKEESIKDFRLKIKRKTP